MASRVDTGGAAADAGIQYARGVAAAVVAAAASDSALPALGLAESDRATSLWIESDYAVDDIAVKTVEGLTLLVQAKRRLDASVLREAVAQWRDHIDQDGDLVMTRLVIACGSMSRTMETLQRVLSRHETETVGEHTKAEAAELERLKALLGEVEPEVFEQLLRAAHIWDIRVEHEGEPGTEVAIGQLRAAVRSGTDADARHAWVELCSLAGHYGRRRGGDSIRRWLQTLVERGVQISDLQNSALATRHAAVLARYRSRVGREGTSLSLKPLGAALPDLSLESADASIEVSESGEQSDGHALLWSFLAHHRATLVGLPGSGKSTALRVVAGQLASDSDLPLPILVRLKDLSQARSGDSVLGTAVRLAAQRATSSEQELLETALHAELKDGTVALLLDGLDEVFFEVGDLLAELERDVANVGENLFVLMSTRRVGSAMARSLGWAELHVHAPADVDRTIGCVLEAAAAQKGVEDAASWVATRREWVGNRLQQERTIKETPLLPVLLTLLACNRNDAALPAGRAQTLLAVVHDFVQRYEFPRHSDFRTSQFTDTQLRSMLTLAFGYLAAEVQRCGGAVSLEVAREDLAVQIDADWRCGLEPAAVLATDCLRILDSGGLLLIDEESQELSARIKLMSEIGDAWRASRLDTLSRREWMRARLASRELESLVLGAALSAELAEDVVATLLESPRDFELAGALLRADDAIAQLSEPSVRSLVAYCVELAEARFEESWVLLGDMLVLPLLDQELLQVEAAAAALSEEHQLVMRMLLRERSAVFAEATEDELAAVVALRKLPALEAVAQPSSSPVRRFFAQRNHLSPALVLAARKWIALNPQRAANAILADVWKRPQRDFDALLRLVRAAGFEVEAREATDRVFAGAGASMAAWLDSIEIDAPERFLAAVAEHGRNPIGPREAVQLYELGAFLLLWDFDYMHQMPEDSAWVRQGIDAMAEHYGLDRSILASEAAVALSRMERWGMEAAYCLTAGQSGHYRRRADEFPSSPATLQWLLDNLERGHARRGAHALYEYPFTDRVAPQLRELIVRELEPARLRVVAVTLASLSGIEEPRNWLASPSPVLRTVCAMMIGDQPTDEKLLARLAEDRDDSVRVEAVRSLARHEVAGWRDLIDHAARTSTGEWTCEHCGAENGAETAKACSRPGCRQAPEDLRSVVSELLAGRVPQSSLEPRRHMVL